MTAWMHKLFWLLQRLLPRGEPGTSMPLWPGFTAALFLGAAAVFSYLAWRLLGAAGMERSRSAGLAALILLGFGLLDWALLAALPRLGLSYGAITRGLLGITGLRLGAFAILTGALLALGGWARLGGPTGFSAQPPPNGLYLLVILNAMLTGLAVYGLYFEPFDLRTTTVRLAGPVRSDGEPLRILQISDIHVERITRRERALLERVEQLKPDLIVLTGDYTNLDYIEDPQALQDTRYLLSQLSAPYGVYAVTGSVDIPPLVDSVFDGLPVCLLQDEVALMQAGQTTLAIIGVSDEGRGRDAEALEELAQTIPADAYRLLLYHTPDLIETAVRQKIDLYLAGHTHGGQVRLPFYGAVVTMSAYGKRYEGGLYQHNPTTLYVSRGVGMEGMGLPRVRFLCPPEITLFELSVENTP